MYIHNKLNNSTHKKLRFCLTCSENEGLGHVLQQRIANAEETRLSSKINTAEQQEDHISSKV